MIVQKIKKSNVRNDIKTQRRKYEKILGNHKMLQTKKLIEGFKNTLCQFIEISQKQRKITQFCKILLDITHVSHMI